MAGPLACESIVNAGNAPITRTINELLGEYGLDPDTLKNVQTVLTALQHYGVTLDPPFENEGGLDTKRTLKTEKDAPQLASDVSAIIDAGGEQDGVELKSSIWIDTNKKAFNPGLEIKEYVSERLATKLAQEMCAFLNRDGGIILLGVKNNLDLCGCSDDLQVFDSDGSPQDKADLIVRQIVEKNFLRPDIVLARTQIQFVEIEGLPVVILRLAAAERLLFLKPDCGSSSQLYLRIGTSADPIKFEKIEDFYRVELEI